MKERIKQTIQSMKQEIVQLGEDLFRNPELGFKEFESKKRIIAELEKNDIHVVKEYFETGFEVQIGNGNGPVIGLIAELDAIVTQGHPQADPLTQAAHSCGHSVQGTVMCGALIALKRSGVLDELNGTVKVFFTPAEEFCDIEYRQQLVEQGKINYLSGKENMLAAGVFDDCDVLLSVHVMGESKYDYSVNSTLAGFTFKRITFLGKAAHAAVIPHLGVNALNAFALFQSAVGMLRETFVDEDKVRIHGMVTEGGQSVNSIPAQVVYECYVRSVNPTTIQTLDKQLEKTAYHCAAALNAEVKIDNIPGYYPLVQSKAVNDRVLANVLDHSTNDKIYFNEISMAAGDIGDISLFKPIIQLGIGGTVGRVHGDSFRISNTDKVYIEPAMIMAQTVIDLLVDGEGTRRIAEEYPVTMSKEEYIRSLEH